MFFSAEQELNISRMKYWHGRRWSFKNRTHSRTL